jgi:hypothetical protein
MTLDHGSGKGLYLMLRRTLQAAQTPEFAKVFCFFSSEKKAFLPSPPHAPTAFWHVP